MNFVERLYEAFRDENIGWDAAKALGDIINPDPILTKANHADVRVSFLGIQNRSIFSVLTAIARKILYVQKYVNTVLPNLIASAKGSNGKDISVYFFILWLNAIHRPC